jgi:hypothetical protein
MLNEYLTFSTNILADGANRIHSFQAVHNGRREISRRSQLLHRSGVPDSRAANTIAAICREIPMWALSGFVQAVSFFVGAVFVVVTSLREPLVDPSMEKRALMRSVSWPMPEG